jgi:hypothetical protein
MFINMDPASQALAQGLCSDVRRTYAALSEQSNVPLSTLHHRARGRLSKQETAKRRQYLTPEEEQAVVNFLLLMCALGQPVRIKFVPSLAFSIGLPRINRLSHPARTGLGPSRNVTQI